MAWTEVTLREQIEIAVRTAAALLAENYRAQDRKRLIRCAELLDEAMRATDGGMWKAQERPETNGPEQPNCDSLTRGMLIVREGAEAGEMRKAG